jgi:hypothetical protein
MPGRASSCAAVAEFRSTREAAGAAVEVFAWPAMTGVCGITIAKASAPSKRSDRVSFMKEAPVLFVF